MPSTVSIRLGCEIEKVIYESRGRGKITSTQYKTWRETFTVPKEGYNKINLTCPICHSSFEVKVYSKSKARLRKLYFASCFLTIAACGIVFAVFAYKEKGFMGYSLAAPFICFTVWQLLEDIPYSIARRLSETQTLGKYRAVTCYQRFTVFMR